MCLLYLIKFYNIGIFLITPKPLGSTFDLTPVNYGSLTTHCPWKPKRLVDWHKKHSVFTVHFLRKWRNEWKEMTTGTSGKREKIRNRQNEREIVITTEFLFWYLIGCAHSNLGYDWLDFQGPIILERNAPTEKKTLKKQ